MTKGIDSTMDVKVPDHIIVYDFGDEVTTVWYVDGTEDIRTVRSTTGAVDEAVAENLKAYRAQAKMAGNAGKSLYRLPDDHPIVISLIGMADEEPKSVVVYHERGVPAHVDADVYWHPIEGRTSDDYESDDVEDDSEE